MLVNKITGKPPPSKAVVPSQHSETAVQPATSVGYYHPMPGQVRNSGFRLGEKGKEKKDGKRIKRKVTRRCFLSFRVIAFIRVR